VAESITPGASDRVGSLIRRRNLSTGEAARWTTIPAFCFAEAVDLIKNGIVYATVYEIYGEGDPSTNYDSYATPGSSYLNISCGAEYARIKDDDGNAEWAAVMHAIIEADDTTVDFTAHPAGGVNYLDIADDRVRVKTAVAGADETHSITTA